MRQRKPSRQWKRRGDGKITRLGAAAEATVWEYLCTHTEPETLKWLQGDSGFGLKLSRESLSRWRSSYQLHLRGQEIERLRSDLGTWARQHLPEFPLMEVMERGVSYFMALAIRDGKLDDFLALYHAEIARKRVAKNEAKAMIEEAGKAAGADQAMMDKIVDAIEAKLVGGRPH